MSGAAGGQFQLNIMMPVMGQTTLESVHLLASGARAFVEQWNAQGPAHHCAVGVGHIATRLEKLSGILGIEMIQVC